MRLSIENVDVHPESTRTEFGFNGEVGVIKNDNNQIVGFYSVTMNDNAITLHEFEILDEFKRQGYGKTFIEKLFKENPDYQVIKGKSLDESVAFYASLDNVTWSSTCDDCCVVECCYNLKYVEIKNHMGMCDDYSVHLFQIRR